MHELIDKALDRLYHRVFDKVITVESIFNDFYGEERVDLQGLSRADVKRTLSEMRIDNVISSIGHIDKHAVTSLRVGILKLGSDELPEDCVNDICGLLDSDTEGKVTGSMTRGNILVHFPKVKITNEYDRYTIAKHIYIMVPVMKDGTEGGLFTMNRSEYTIDEMVSNYMHSHAAGIPVNDFSAFVHCCLGRGPIEGTQTALNRTFDEDRWKMFCLELQKYVETESIVGVPYHRLESIGNRNGKVNGLGWVMPSYVIPSDMKEFFTYYIDHNDLTFSYSNGIYSIGMSFLEYLIRISNSYIEWLNRKLSSTDPSNPAYYNLYKRRIHNDELYEASDGNNSSSDSSEYDGQYVCTFKGKEIKVKVTGTMSENDSPVVLLIDHNVASCFLYRLLNVINYRYGREKRDGSSDKVRYCL